MLIEFSVKNFLSFKNKVTLSMEKGNGDENLDNIISTNNVDLLKTAAIYGANASGKSNLIKALTFAILFIRNSNNNTVGMRLPIINSFMFDVFTMEKPSEFEFDFISSNIRYKYAFSADVTKVYNESLDAYYTQKPTNIFTRTNTNEYTFPKAEESKLKSIESKNTENKLFLATATNWNYEKTKDAYLWFVNCIDTYNSFDSISKEVLIDYSNNGELKAFTLNMLREFDIFIKDLNVSYEEKEMDTNMVNMFVPPAAKAAGTPMVSNVKIELIHEVVDKSNNTYNIGMGFESESEGTRILFSLAPFLKYAFEENKVIVIDELEKSLHPAIVEYIIKMFNNKKINKSNSQLIFTTHATNLLSLELFRRDQIWFTEKDPKTAASDLYPLDSFSVRKDENIQKGYINGRYGAIPFIRDIDLWLEDN